MFDMCCIWYVYFLTGHFFISKNGIQKYLCIVNKSEKQGVANSKMAAILKINFIFLLYESNHRSMQFMECKLFNRSRILNIPSESEIMKTMRK